MKRVDFDPNGERNPQNRGKSGYVRISWEEALDLVADEIKRLKRAYGPGVMAVSHGSHHTWGNIGYYLSALFRFRNAVGYTQIHHNPDSWEGWYWGAVHHWGYTLRVGQSETYGTVEDCLQNCDMIVFWAADPESTQRLLRRAGRHRAPAVAEESQARHQGRPRRSVLQRVGAVPAGQVVRAAGRPPRSRWRWRSPMSGSRKTSTTRSTSQTHTVGFDKWKAYLDRRGGRHRQDAGVAGEGDRRSGQGRARAGARMGPASASISRPAAGATATAAPAATRPASSGRA